jgi:hypothetical protein
MLAVGRVEELNASMRMKAPIIIPTRRIVRCDINEVEIHDLHRLLELSISGL